ncbi:hypothetical protein A3K86_08700 [Photobacterium jeanii]|uniref:ADP-heptose--LPS heptosyltransferase n=2 Tax=Photobacterium jeanii TaxID=858640 RepID=A0A178KJV4_9GAMM|nr:hypothetical protein A3K86_08700 [Photobacterium jeanii]
MNASVLEGNPFIDETFIYTKTKHRKDNQSVLATYIERFSQLLKLRLKGVDVAILANPQPCKQSLKVAKLVGAKKIIGANIQGENCLTHSFMPEDFSGKHQVEHVHSYLTALTEQVPSIPTNKIFPVDDEVQRLQTQLSHLDITKPVVGIHISVRRPDSRWPIERYVTLMQKITEQESDTQFLLFWAPEKAEDNSDKGDSLRAKELLAQCEGLNVSPVPTASIEELKAGFSLCSSIICSDGGPMHLAAALDKKLLVFFGKTPVDHWHPWCEHYQILQTDDGKASSVSVDMAYKHWNELMSN